MMATTVGMYVVDVVARTGVEVVHSKTVTVAWAVVRDKRVERMRVVKRVWWTILRSLSGSWNGLLNG